MVDEGGGSIVLLASMMSFQGGFNIAAYAASKGGVAQLAKALSNELAGAASASTRSRPATSRRT